MHPLTFALMDMVLMADLDVQVHNSIRNSASNCSMAFSLYHRSCVCSLVLVLSPTLLGWLGLDDDGLLFFGEHFRELGLGHIWC